MNQEEQDQINKWTEQADTFTNFDKYVEDVSEYLTRQLKVFSMLLDNGNYDQANKFAQDIKKYGYMFRVLSKHRYDPFKDYIKTGKLHRSEGTALNNHIEKMWSDRFDANYMKNGDEYVVFKY